VLFAPRRERRGQRFVQLRCRERLDEVVHGAALERPHRVMNAAEVRGDDAPHAGVAGERRVEHVEPVAAGDPDVNDHAVVGEPLDAIDRVCEGAGFGAGEPAGLES
jgi:hypothetical protein